MGYLNRSKVSLVVPASNMGCTITFHKSFKTFTVSNDFERVSWSEIMLSSAETKLYSDHEC